MSASVTSEEDQAKEFLAKIDADLTEPWTFRQVARLRGEERTVDNFNHLLDLRLGATGK